MKLKRKLGNRASCTLSITIVSLPLFAGCNKSTEPTQSIVFEYNFNNDYSGWRSIIADYPAGREDDIGFETGDRIMPEPYSYRKALYHRGDNISDDLFLGFYKQVSGLSPNTNYKLTFKMEFASNYGEDCAFGVGTSVFIKAGASTIEPMAAMDSTGMFRTNIDKGQQQNDGTNALILDDIRNGQPGCDSSVLYSIAKSEIENKSILATTDDTRKLWLIFGTESAFESVHELYFTGFKVYATRTDN